MTATPVRVVFYPDGHFQEYPPNLAADAAWIGGGTVVTLPKDWKSRLFRLWLREAAIARSGGPWKCLEFDGAMLPAEFVAALCPEEETTP